MAITRLKRKDRKNKARANNKQTVIKQLLRVPVIKNVDPEELKAQFGKPGVVGTVKKAISEVAHKVEDVVEAVKEKVDSALHSDESKSAE